jgi:hypothetical protein
LGAPPPCPIMYSMCRIPTRARISTATTAGLRMGHFQVGPDESCMLSIHAKRVAKPGRSGQLDMRFQRITGPAPERRKHFTAKIQRARAVLVVPSRAFRDRHMVRSVRSSPCQESGTE